MKNLSNFNLLIIILLFSSCRQQPFTGTVHIIPYPNQIAIGTQYRPIGKNLSIYLSPESGMDKDYIEDLLSDTGVKCKFTNFKWIADLTFDIEPDTIGLEGYRLVSNDYGTKITASDTKTNLVSNAIRYSKENGRVIIGTHQDGNMVEIYVQDFGKGIDPRYHQSIFDRYFRVPGTKVQGSGLGLSISKDFVEAHGGTLSVESELGKGSRFILRLKS